MAVLRRSGHMAACPTARIFVWFFRGGAEVLQPQMGGYAVGRVLGDRYRVEMVLAQRASNIVCLGRDLVQPELTVVVYSLPDLELAGRLRLLQQLFQDAMIVDLERRDDLVEVLDFGVEPYSGTLFLVLEHRQDQPASALIALAGPESKTAAVFAEMARGMLESHDAELLKQDEPTNPGVRLSDLPNRPRTGHSAPLSYAPHPTGPPSSSASASPLSSYAGVWPTDPEVPPRRSTTTGGFRVSTGMHRIPVSESSPGPVSQAYVDPIQPSRSTPASDPPTLDLVPVKPRTASDIAAAPAPTATAQRSTGSWLFTSALVATAVLGGAYAVGLFDGLNAPPPDAEDPNQVGRNYYGAKRHVTVSSNPAGAQVHAGFKPLGATPIQIERPESPRQLTLRVSKAGYDEQSVVVESSSPSLLRVVLTQSERTAAEPRAPAPVRDLRTDPDR